VPCVVLLVSPAQVCLAPIVGLRALIEASWFCPVDLGQSMQAQSGSGTTGGYMLPVRSGIIACALERV